MSSNIGEQLRQRAKEYTPPPQKRGLRYLVSQHYKDIKHARQHDLPWEEIAKVLGTEISAKTLKKYFYEESSARKRWKKTQAQTTTPPTTDPPQTSERLSDSRTLADFAPKSSGRPISFNRPPEANDSFTQQSQ